jgi:ribonuclease BN (tRNA processing enzyme)
MLTHFRSSEYVDVEALRAEAASIFPGPVDAAEDLLRVAF